MERFWDSRAREDAFFFVDDRLSYRAPDHERFWANGVADLDRILAGLCIAVEPGDTVVEIGCGLGRLTRPLSQRAHAVHAIDVSGEMLRRARSSNSDLNNVTWTQGSGHDLAPVATASADVCFSHVVFQHIPDPAITLGYVREMARVLRPGGWAGFQLSTAEHVHSPPRTVSRLRAQLLGWMRRRPRGQGHPAWRGSAVDLDELRSVAADAGLDVERIEGAGTQFCLALLRRRASAE